MNMKQEIDGIVAWLKDYATKANRKSFVVGVSGGLDSAVVSTLCGMTGLPTHCVILPCQTKPNETERGLKHIKWLSEKFGSWGNGIHIHEIDLTNTFEVFRDEVEPYYGDNGLAYANAKSRLRMVALYHVATVYSGLVVGTGNKVEDFGVGFFTKYGDGGVDLSPIGEFTKTEVREMAGELGINQEIIDVAPTDGLWEDARTDEQALGASYQELEWAMKFYSFCEECKLGAEKEHLTPRQHEVLAIYTKWHNAGQHKLNPIPVYKRK